MFDLTYLGAATVHLSSSGTGILVDPFVTDNTLCPYDLEEALDVVGDVDVLCVTHLATDHLGDCLELASTHDVPVVTEPGVEQYLALNGVPRDQVTTVAWGMTAHVGGIDVRALETRHHSSRVVDGDLLSGTPLSFLIDDGDASVYHMGDTSLFGNLQTFGDLYRPDAALVGVGQADVADEGGAVTRTLSEMTPEEAALAATWVQSGQVIPMHYRERGEREAFLEAVDELETPPEVTPVEPGESIRITGDR